MLAEGWRGLAGGGQSAWWKSGAGDRMIRSHGLFPRAPSCRGRAGMMSRVQLAMGFVPLSDSAAFWTLVQSTQVHVFVLRNEEHTWINIYVITRWRSFFLNFTCVLFEVAQGLEASFL